MQPPHARLRDASSPSLLWDIFRTNDTQRIDAIEGNDAAAVRTANTRLYTGGAHPMLLESARGSGNLVSTLSGDTRGVAALSGDTRGVAAPSEDRGPFSCMLPPFSLY